MEESDVLMVETHGAVGTIKLNRPKQRNAMSPDLLVGLHATLSEWAETGEVRAAVITGTGEKAFSSGYDIRAIPTNLTPETEKLLRESNALDLGLSAVKNFPYPTIAMLNGVCFGGALNLAMCCDIRVAVDDVTVGMPPAKLGVVYPPDGLAQFVAVLGMSRTREIFFTGRSFHGIEAKEMGLVDRLVPRAELEATSYALADEIAENAPLALKGLKRTLNLLEEALRLSGNARSEAEALVAAALSSEDVQEGQMAFLEKRKPRFAGR